jgi:hypothetical protein
MEHPEWLEAYKCSECGNVFYVQDIGEMQHYNQPGYCCYCGCEFQYMFIVEDGDEEGLRMAMKRGNRVYVQWWDISADLHTEDRIEPILAECVGWIERNNKKELALTYCRYKKGTCKLKDGIAIPKGAVESVEVI